MAFGQQIDNSKFTPEFHNGQSNNATVVQNTNTNPDNADVGQATQQQDMDGQLGNQQFVNNTNIQNDGQGQSAQPEFETQEDLLEAYNALKNEVANKDKSYKELQKAFTKARQEISMNKKLHSNMQPNSVQSNQYYRPQQQTYSPMNNMYPQFNNGMGMPNQQRQAIPVIPDYNSYAYARQQQEQMQNYNNQQVNQTMVQLAVDGKIAELQNQDPEFDEVAVAMWDMIENDPYFKDVEFTSPDMARNTVGIAYNMAKQKIEQAKTNIKINNAITEGYKNRQNKIMNNDMSNVATQRSARQQKKTAEEMVKENIINAKPLKF